MEDLQKLQERLASVDQNSLHESQRKRVENLDTSRDVSQDEAHRAYLIGLLRTMSKSQPMLERDKRSKNLTVLRILLQIDYGYSEAIIDRAVEEIDIARVVKKCRFRKVTPEKAARVIDKLMQLS